ncbi:DUF11 domain-containing protein, partial [Microbacterium tenebrionis]|uniref:DUF11 domain-containing protein n=1 Tax=Microbacterium tenebrionis TaxID=2830665 RepID=UPI00202B9C60
MTATPPTGPPVGANSPAVVLPTAAAGPGLVTTKSASVSGTGAVGDVISYTITTRNSGNVTLSGVTIDDPLPGITPLQYTWPGPENTLAPAQTVTATTSYTITQADVDAGSVTNTATGQATAPNGASVASPPASVTSPTVGAAPRIQVVKTGSLPGGAEGVAGETITWTLTITNTGNVTLTGVGATDSAPGVSALIYGPWPGGTAGTLAPGASVTATATSVVRQSDVNAGSVANTATATGTPARGQAATAMGSATVPLAAAPALTIDKAGAYTNGTGAVGDTITYTYTVRNTGNVTLTGITIADPHNGLSAISYGAWPGGTAGTLDPTQTVTATATYVVRQSDVNAGSISDTATVSGRPPAGAAVNATSQTVVLPTADAAPAIETNKTSSVSGTGAVGDLVTYTITARNTGNVTLTGVTISDPLPGLNAPVYGQWPGPARTLQPGQTVTATATYRITQADLDAGSITNTATATGKPPTGADVSDPDSITTPVAPQTPAYTLTKTGALAPGTTGHEGDTVNFSFTVRNTGNVTLNAVRLSDQLDGISQLAYVWPGAEGRLVPGQTMTATATYALTQADVDAGVVTNTVNGTATPPTGAAVTRTAEVDVSIAGAPSMTLEKTGTVLGAGEAGDTIRFGFTIVNTGNVTIDAIALTDSIPGVSPDVTWPGAEGVLSPGQQATATADYEITQDDVDAGSVVNSAAAEGRSRADQPVRAADEVTVSTGTQRAELTLEKSASPTTGVAVGDVVTFTFDVTNSGNVTIDSIALADELPGLSSITFGPWPSATGTLAPRDTVTATATYTVTQADVDAGGFSNSATLTGESRGGVDVSDTSAVDIATVEAAPAITLTKTTGADAVKRGDTIEYAFRATNSGNTTLTGVSIADELDGVSAIDYGSWPSGEAGVLAPGQSVTATAQYVVTQADVDAGVVTNRATASGAPPTGPAVTGSDSIDTAAAPSAPALLVEKSGALAAGSTGRAGDTVEYGFVIQNTGDVTISNVVLGDPLPGISTIQITWPQAEGVLAPGQRATGTATYALTQNDVDAGAVVNTATVTATPSRGSELTRQASETVAIAPGAGLSAVKSGALLGDGIGEVGDVIQYAVRATNTGNVTITGGQLIDPMPGLYDVSITWPGADGRLDVGQSVTGQGKHRITQADVDRGYVENTATVGGQTPQGQIVKTDTNTVRISTVQHAPAIAVAKSGTASGTGAVGDTIEYSFEIINSGNVTLTGVTLSDPLPGVELSSIAWPAADAPGRLEPGQKATATGVLEITQEHLDAGRVINTATATGTPPAGADVSGASPENVVTTAAGRPALTVTNSGALAPGAAGRAGDVVTWTYVLTNSGNVTLSGVALSDAVAGISDPAYTWTTPVGVLAPGDSVTATATYALTQADVDAGSVSSLVTGSGKPAVGDRVSSTAPATLAVAPDPALVLTKTARPAPAPSVGDTITYDFTIDNPGNVTISVVRLMDELTGLSDPVFAWPGAPRILAPGQQATATATYVVTQADVDRGGVVNSATAVGAAPGGVPVESAEVEITTATVAAAPAITTRKSTVGETEGRVGDRVTYLIEVENTGNVTLHDVQVADPLPGLSSLSLVWPDEEGVIAPGEIVTAQATYQITQTDVDRGTIANTATGTGTPPTGPAVSDDDEHTLTTAAAAADATVVKDGRLAAGATGAVGDEVQYSFTIRNTGNVTLNAVALDDTLAGISEITYTWPGVAGVLAPGQAATATARYALTQVDIDHGFVDNSVTLDAAPTRGDPIQRTSSKRVDIPRVPGLVAVKSGELIDGGIGQVGDVIRYRVTATNTGNVTLTGGALVDPMEGLENVSIDWPDPDAEGVLEVGQSVTGIGTYALRQSDIDRGYVENTAHVATESPDGQEVRADTNTVRISTVQAAGALAVTKSGVMNGDGGVGSRVDYTFRVTNTGNVTVSEIALNDRMPGLSEPEITWPGTAEQLAPGDTAIATATYTVTQADVDAGSIVNAANATGDSRGGAVTSPQAPATVSTQNIRASIDVTKTGALEDGATGAAGDRVVWSYTLENTSNVTLTGVTLTDELSGEGIEYVWPDASRPGVLLPGETVTATATYTLTQADVDRGSVGSAVDGAAAPPRGSNVTDSANASVLLEARPGIRGVKTGTVNGEGAVGDTIDYAFEVENTGNVTLTLVDLKDALAGVSDPVFAWPGEPGILAPGQSVTATADYTITQADVDRGTVTNIATARGKPPVGDIITSSTDSVESTVVAAEPALDVRKSAAVDGDGAVGDRIDYVFEIENTGNVTLTGLVLDDPLAGLSTPVIQWPADPGVLAPGQTATATAQYSISQTDVDAGDVINTASASGHSRAGEVRDDSETVTTPTEPSAPAIAVAKHGELEPGGTGEVGEIVTYEFVIANDGNQTLTGIELDDRMVGLSDIEYIWPGADGVLAPGGSASAVATYALTQQDIDAGAVANVVIATGTAPGGGDVASEPTPETVEVPRVPGLVAVKSGELIDGGIGQVGDVIRYRVTATNTGNVTLTG